MYLTSCHAAYATLCLSGSFTTVMAKSFQTTKICISYTLFLHFPAPEVCQRASTWWPGLSPWAHPFVSPPPTGSAVGAGCSVCWANSWLPRLAVGKEPELVSRQKWYPSGVKLTFWLYGQGNSTILNPNENLLSISQKWGVSRNPPADQLGPLIRQEWITSSLNLANKSMASMPHRTT